MTDPNPHLIEEELRWAEARIAEALVPRAQPTAKDGRHREPAPYLRRHLVEHAAAGHVLDGTTITDAFLPYADADRVRASLSLGREPTPQLQAFTRVAHAWDWDCPQANQAALEFTVTTLTSQPARAPSDGWSTRWAHWNLSPGTILTAPLTGHTRRVNAVATLVLPDGRPIAVTGSADDTVRVWDLTTGTQIGDPLTGHTHRVTGVATGVLPDGRPVAVTGSFDGTVRVWDLLTGGSMGVPLRVFEPVDCLTAGTAGKAFQVCIGGPGIALVEFRAPKLQ